ncbi:MAG: hypothetical protein ACU0BN_00385 [Sulfitobacter sp.]
MMKAVFPFLTASIIALAGTDAAASLSSERYAQILQSIKASCSGAGTNCAAIIAAAKEEIQSAGGRGALTDNQLSGLVSVLTENIDNLPPELRAAVGAELSNVSDSIENEVQREAARTVAVFVGSGGSSNSNQSLSDDIVAVLGSPN